MKDVRLFLTTFGSAAVSLVIAAGCASSPGPGTPVQRHGDEIVAAGQMFRVGTPVVLWTDPGGYDAYRVERRFAAFDESNWDSSSQASRYLNSPNRYGLRKDGLTPHEIERVRGGGWDLPLLRRVVDQFVYHYDVCGTSRQCFNILHDHRGLSVHFMLDIDGTIYQTLDLKERAWHASIANSRSVGIEIANMGAYRLGGENPFDQWYAKNADGVTRITIPERFGDGGVRTPDFVGHPRFNQPVIGNVQGENLIQYDYTPEQYEALIKLTAALCRIFPNLTCDYPRDADGNLITKKLSDEELKTYQGLIGHYHIQLNKTDPGPAFDWDHVVEGARRLLESNLAENAKGNARMRVHLNRE